MPSYTCDITRNALRQDSSVCYRFVAAHCGSTVPAGHKVDRVMRPNRKSPNRRRPHKVCMILLDTQIVNGRVSFVSLSDWTVAPISIAAL